MGSGPLTKKIAPWPVDEPPPPSGRDRRDGAGLQSLVIGLLGTAIAAAAFVLAPSADARFTSAEPPVEAARIDATSDSSAALLPTTTAAPTTVTVAPVTTAAGPTTTQFRITTTTAAPAPSTTEPAPTTTSPTTTRSVTTTTSAPTTLATTTTAPRTLIVRDISTSKVDSGASWIAVATISVADQSGAVAAQAPVSVSWSTGIGGQCTTDPSGKCTIYLPALTVPQVAVTMVSPSPGITRTITR